ncbi:DUF6691 family protein [Polycladidibacter hongkongensis]|uniref:DUF6691 family protein n=1 Tax=Polycladidibacter hongkongensis TaxID=1647556 RepID=UPI00082FAE3D|nr:DUF6691 family protein [Pseudovibrio hongkongensis]
MRVFYGLLAGLLFGAGLTVAEMVNPLKVQNFLDVFGNWDPSLAFVMGGAILVAYPFFQMAHKMRRPVACEDFQMPTKIKLEKRLVIGSAIFGVGWGLAGLCPGPAVAVQSFAQDSSFLLFLATMAVGMFLARAVNLYVLR